MTETTADASPTPPIPARKRGAWVWFVFASGGLLLALVLAVGGAAAWFWGTEAGTRQLLSWVPGLETTGLKGRVTGGSFGAETLRYRSDGLDVQVEGLTWRDLSLRWRPHADAWVGVTLEQPKARSVKVVTTPKPKDPNAPPLQPPADLKLPLVADVNGLAVGSIVIDQQEAITDLRADLHLSADGGSVHRVQGLQLTRGPLKLGGAAAIGSGSELPLDAAVKVIYGAGAGTGGGIDDWQAEIDAKGPLRQLALNAKLDAVGDATAKIRAGVAPFKPFPLTALDAQLSKVDLAVFAKTLPRTSLSGTAVLGDITASAPLAVSLDFKNASAGPWDAKRLPVRSLQIALQGRLEELDRLRFDALQLELGGEQAAGRVTGSGRWQGSDLQVDLRVDDLQPQRLDGRAPEMRIDGPINLALHGLPVPAAASSASAPAASATAAPPPAPTSLRGEFKVGLTGQLPPQGRRKVPPVSIETQGRFESPGNGALRLVLNEATIKAGDATATANADVRLSPKGQLQIKSEGKLAQFDPGVWVPQAAGRGAINLNGNWRADLTLPPAPANAKAAAALPVIVPGLPSGLLGTVELRIDPSRFADLSVQGDATLKAEAAVLNVLALLQAGSNKIKVDGSAGAGEAGVKGAAASGPGNQRWKLDLQAPVLAELAPLKAFIAGAGPKSPGWFPSNGSVDVQATANGRWPTLKTEGTVRVADFSSPLLEIRKADARWTFAGTAPNAPLSLDATVLDIAQGVQRVERLQIKLDGTPRAHTLAVEAASPVRPPEWAESGVVVTAAPASPASSPAVAPAADSGSLFVIKGNGGWQPSANGGAWAGTVSQVRAAPRAQPGTPWLSAQELKLVVRVDESGAPVQASVEPNRIDAFGGGLSWQRAQWQPPSRAGAPPRIVLDATLEPLKVAPWLMKLQPQFGWSGDLALAGTIKLRSDTKVDADVVIERSGEGDLSLTIEGATRALGLKQLRVALEAHDGLWEVKQSVDGRNIGVISGSQTVRTRSDVLVPDANAALQGSLGLVVPQLQVWAPWLPPGWRLGGRLQAGAVLSGTFGAPAYTGTVLGSKLEIKNLFQGVNLRDGELSVALEGTEAKIERFEMRGGGDGVLRITGGASFGEAPSADLRIVADKFRALDRIDRRVAISGNADVAFAAKKLKLGGKFTIDEGLIDITQSGAPTLDDDVVVFNQPGGPAATQPPKPPPKPAAKPTNTSANTSGKLAAQSAPPPGALAQADVELHVDLGQKLRLRGRGLNTLLRGELVITTPGGELAVNGVIRAEEGTYTAYGQNLSVDRGRIFFTGDVANPRLDILAIRADIDTRVGVVVSGPAANPRVRLYSETSLSEFDTLTWLVLGRAPEGLGRDDTALLQRAALALLAGDKDSSGGVINKLGLDELSVGSGTQGTIVSLGKQVSKRVFIGYEKALSAAGGTWNLIYRVAGRITLRARAGSDNAIDAIWTWRWD